MTRGVPLVAIALLACGGSAAPHARRVAGAPVPTPPPPSGPSEFVVDEEAPLPPHTVYQLDPTPKAKRRMVPPEAFLRAYLTWFGGLSPHETFLRARGDALFDRWKDYLVALGLPDYQLDAPRAGQSNAVMLATMGRLGEALCIRAAEHDVRDDRPLVERTLFVFGSGATTRATFEERFDILHRTFLGYPSRLAPNTRVDRFYGLFQRTTSRATGKLRGEARAWAAVCTALIQHPEAGLY